MLVFQRHICLVVATVFLTDGDTLNYLLIEMTVFQRHICLVAATMFLTNGDTLNYL